MRGAYRAVFEPPIQFCYVFSGTEAILKDSIIKDGFPYPKGFSVDKDSIEITGIRDGKASVSASGILIVGACDSGDETHTIGVPVGPVVVNYTLKLEEDDGSKWSVLGYDVRGSECDENCENDCRHRLDAVHHLELDALVSKIREERVLCTKPPRGCWPDFDNTPRRQRADGSVELRIYDSKGKHYFQKSKCCVFVIEKDVDGFWTAANVRCPR